MDMKTIECKVKALKNVQFGKKRHQISFFYNVFCTFAIY